MAEASYKLEPKTVQVKTIGLKMSIGEANATLNALNGLATPNAKQVAVRDALTAALASAPPDDLP